MLETKQARIVALMAIIIILFYPIFIGVNIAKTSNITLGLIVWAIVTLLSIPPALLVIYDVNCTVIGNCNVWSWLKTIIYVLTTIGLIIILLGVVYMKKKNQELKQTTSEKSNVQQEKTV